MTILETLLMDPLGIANLIQGIYEAGHKAGVQGHPIFKNFGKEYFTFISNNSAEIVSELLGDDEVFA